MKYSRPISTDLLASGYCSVDSKDIILDPIEESGFLSLSIQWEKLPPDEFLQEVDDNYADEVYRFRRWGKYSFNFESGELKPLDHEPFFQSAMYNAKAGGFERNFAPWTPEIYNNPFLCDLIKFGFENLPIAESEKKAKWQAYVHLIKVQSSKVSQGKPAPEGIHQDDVEFFSVHLIEAKNLIGGEVQIYDLERQLIDEIQLKKPLDCYYVSDKSVMHGVSEVSAKNPQNTAERNVLIISYKIVE